MARWWLILRDFHPLRPHDHWNKWSCKATWQIKYTTSPPAETPYEHQTRQRLDLPWQAPDMEYHVGIWQCQCNCWCKFWQSQHLAPSRLTSTCRHLCRSAFFVLSSMLTQGKYSQSKFCNTFFYKQLNVFGHAFGCLG